MGFRGLEGAANQARGTSREDGKDTDKGHSREGLP